MAFCLQRASLWKRISAWLFDVILLTLLSVLLMWGISALIGFDAQYAHFDAYYKAVAAEYQLDMEEINQPSYSELTEDVRTQIEQANAALAANEEASKAYALVTQMTVLTVSLGLLLGHLLLEFFVPLRIGNGQTIGKKVFGVAVMRKNGVRIGHISLFIRTILGKYAVETMTVVMMAMMFMLGNVNPVALILVFGVGVTQLVMLLSTQTHLLIHDQLADTVTVDFASQKIFHSETELLNFKQQHADTVTAKALETN